MLTGTTVIVAAVGYALLLFAIAWWGDNGGRAYAKGRGRTIVYALSLGVYCTSWTYYGSVGLASRHGLDFLPIYIGPILVMAFGRSLLVRVAGLAKAQNLTTVADFVAARYGKSQIVAALAAAIALIASAPYIALQLKAIVQTLLMVVRSFDDGSFAVPAPSPALSLVVAMALAGFAIAFGTRRIDPTEHQDGLMLAIAVESLLKLLAFLAVGVFVVWSLNGGLSGLTQLAESDPQIGEAIGSPPDAANWIVGTLLSSFAILMLPRQFHVTIVENRDPRDIATASWSFPVYLALINLFVLPIAVAGLATFPDGEVNRDLTVLALPLHAGAKGLALTTMLGGLSAATGMVVVDSVALAITIGNDLVMPLALRRRGASAAPTPGDYGALVLVVRRLAIVGVLVLGYLYARAASEAALASFGFLSFAAIAQIGPAFFGGLVWRRGTARGAAAGMIAGLAAWAYLMLLPSLSLEGDFARLVTAGPLGLAWLAPSALTGFSPYPIVGGVALSLGLNVLGFVLVSLMRQATPLERTQADVFLGAAPQRKAQTFRLWRAATSVGELETTVARYLGAERARRAFEAFARERGASLAKEREADAHLVRHAEHLLSSAIGASTSRFVLSRLVGRRGVSRRTALKMFDDATAEIQTSRDQLQHALDHARQGITVFDSNLSLRTWNREFVDLFDFPPSFLRAGLGLDAIVRFNASRGVYGPGSSDDFVAERIESLLNDEKPSRLRLRSSERVLEIRSARLPDGGIVTTYTDVTETVRAEEALAEANEELERRVQERTAELERLNRELAGAKTAAEEANLSKTRFLAAAGHDILQPLNAARLYASALNEAVDKTDDKAQLAGNVDASLEAVEEIIGALLDISRLDAGAIRPVVADIPVNDVFRLLEIEFTPIAAAKELKLRFMPCELSMRTDRHMIRRLLQNLVSNAIKYTPRGRVLVGCRRAGEALRIEVWDTGLGIPESRQREVFQEFQRLDEGARAARGLGLGLSIVERLARVLGHTISLRSRPGKGSVFSVTAPIGAKPSVVVEEVPAPSPASREPLAGLFVLAIDNEPRALEGMRNLLDRWGCRVETASGLKEAIAALDRAGAPDVVVADYHLDEGDGLAAIAAIRGRCARDIAAILATADRSQDVRDAAQRADVQILNKPVKPAPLRALLARTLVTREAAE